MIKSQLSKLRKLGLIGYFKHMFLENRSDSQTIFKNTFWLFLAEGVNKGLMFFLTILIARSLGASGYGQFAFALSFTSLFAVFADFGLSTLTIREVARNKSLVKKYVDNISVIKMFLGVITFGLIFLIVQFMGKSSSVKTLVYLFGVYVILNSFSEFFRSVFRAFEKMQYEAVSKIVQGLVLFFVGLLVLHLGATYVVLAYVVGSFFGLIASLFYLRKFSWVKLELDFGIWKSVLKESWPFALGSIFVSVYFSIDSLMISFFKGDTELGYYALAYGIMTGFYIIPSLLSNVYFPKLSYAYKHDGKKLKKLIWSFIKKISLIVFLLVLLLFFCSKPFFDFVYGDGFNNSVGVFKLLIFVLVFKFYGFPFGFLLSASDGQKKRLFAQGTTALFNIITNLIFIPWLGIMGAAITTLMSEFLLVCLYVFFTRKMVFK
ncbi:flippase [Candidatus Woesearchaeota archaeon]|nr:flippase [Candidatus Woesearchaeota archaeon]